MTLNILYEEEKLMNLGKRTFIDWDSYFGKFVAKLLERSTSKFLQSSFAKKTIVRVEFFLNNVSLVHCFKMLMSATY